MPAAITDKFAKVISGTTRPVATTLASQKLSGAGSASVVATTGWDTSTAVHGIMYRVDASNVKVPGSQIDWKGTISGTTINDFTVTAGSDDTYEVGTVVELSPTAAWGDDMATGLVVEHNQDGTHGAVTATSVATTAGITVGTTLGVTGATTLTGAVTLKSYDGWIYPTDTWTYASATTFTIAGVDRTAQFPVGTKIKLTQTTAKYFYVTASSFSTNTTITVTGGSDYSLANATITTPALSYDATPQGFPGSFAFSTTWTGVTAQFTSVNRFWIKGNVCTVSVSRSTNQTSNATSMTATLPVTAKTVTSMIWRGWGGRGVDNGAAYNSPTPYCEVTSGASVVNLYTGPQPGNWTAANSKGMDFQISYEI